MRAYQIVSTDGFEDLRRIERPQPEAGPGQVVVRVRACSLNYRDTIIVRGGYPRNDTRPVVPLSDGAGDIVAVGAGAGRWKTGDRVCVNFLRDWTAGAITEPVMHTCLGGSIDGMLSEYVAMPAHALVRIPSHLSYEEAATLPCAAVTAWNALTGAGTKAGDDVLLLGTGGVSIFGLQLAKAMGARVLITTSSDDKGARAKQLGADIVINYRTRPEWHEAVREATGGRGADHVLEVGGLGTLQRSLMAVRVGGTISLIGLLTQAEPPSILSTLLNAQTIRGIYVGSVEMFEAMNRVIELQRLRPVIDRTFPFDQAPEAYRHLAQQVHVGKVVIAIP